GLAREPEATLADRTVDGFHSACPQIPAESVGAEKGAHDEKGRYCQRNKGNGDSRDDRRGRRSENAYQYCSRGEKRGAAEGALAPIPRQRAKAAPLISGQFAWAVRLECVCCKGGRSISHFVRLDASCNTK